MLWQYRLVRLVPWNRFVGRQMIELRSFSSLPVLLAGHNTTLHRSFSKVKDSAVTEMYFEEIFEQGYEAQDPLFDLRHFLYPDSGDPYVQVLSNASNVSEVLSCIAEIQEPLPSHLTQALATLHHFQKVYQFRSYDFRKEAEDSFVSFNSQLVQEDGFKLILQLIEKFLPRMTFLENSFSLMALRKLGIPLSDPLMHALYIRLIKNKENLNLESLSYLTVALRPRLVKQQEVGFGNWMFGLLPVIPRLSTLLDEGRTAHDLKRIAICFSAMSAIISEKMMNRFADKMRSMVEAGMYQSVEDVSKLNKHLSLVISKSDWHRENQDFVRLILDLHKGKVHNLTPIHVILLGKVLNFTGQPYHLFQEVYESLVELIRPDKKTVGGVSSISLLSCVLELKKMAVPLPEVRDRIRGYLENDDLIWDLDTFFTVIKCSGIMDKQLIDNYFQTSLQLVECEKHEVKNLGLMLLSLNSFNNGFYRNPAIVDKMADILENSIKDASQTRDFAEHLALLLSFGRKLSEDVLSKFYSILPQFNSFALMTIAGGIKDQLNLQNRNKQGLKPRDFQDEEYQLLDEMSLAISRAGYNMLMNPSKKLRMVELSFLLKSFTMRSASFDEEYYQLIKNKILEQADSMQIYHVYLLTLSLRLVNPVLEFPELTDKMLELLNTSDQTKDLHVKMMTRLLIFCFKSNHDPGKQFLEAYSQALYRDMDNMSGRRILNSAIILATFNHLPNYLAKGIFSNEFMNKLDSEIKMYDDSRSYNAQLRFKLMELNRSLVLQFPEHGVPWFHENYCKENPDQHQDHYNKFAAAFRAEVYDELCNVVGGWRYVKENSCSRYYNPVHFEVGYNQEGELVDLHSSTDVPTRRIAVQAYPDICYTQDTKKLQGESSLNNIQLNLQDWQVVTINPFSWNSMYLSSSTARRQFLNQTFQTMAEREEPEPIVLQ